MGDKITYEQRTGTNACDMYYAYDNDGKLFGLYYNGTFFFYKRNVQGDIIGLLNTSGTEVVTYEYDTWGKLLSTTGTLASTLGERNPFRYRGYYYDAETGLYYLNQRYYNPEWGRLISADSYGGSTGKLLSHNVFAYCSNNPVMMSDPSGRLAIALPVVAVALLALAVVGVAYIDIAINGENSLSGRISTVVLDSASELMQGVSDALSKAKEQADYYKAHPYHHIVAQNAKIAKPAQDVLDRAVISRDDDRNLVQLKPSLHYVLHNNYYYLGVNAMMKMAEKSGQVETALSTTKSFLSYMNEFAP